MIEWIKPSRRLPKEYKDVLVCALDNDGNPRTRTARFYKARNRWFYGSWDDYDFDIAPENVLFWAEIPEPPINDVSREIEFREQSAAQLPATTPPPVDPAHS